MILQAGGLRSEGDVLENGCGVGMYVVRLAEYARSVTGLEFDLERALLARETTRTGQTAPILCAAGETLPFPKRAST